MADDLSGIPEPNEQEPEAAAVWKNKYAYLLADLKNIQNRLTRSFAQELQADIKSLLRDVLPVADGLDMALLHSSTEEDNSSIISGVELIRNILEKFFTKYDVTTIDAWGRPFDPTLHEAVGMVTHSTFPPNTVARIEQKGYLYGSQLLRPARVFVVSSRQYALSLTNTRALPR